MQRPPQFRYTLIQLLVCHRSLHFFPVSVACDGDAEELSIFVRAQRPCCSAGLCVTHLLSEPHDAYQVFRDILVSRLEDGCHEVL